MYTNKELNFLCGIKKNVSLSSTTINENGIEPDENFYIDEIIGNFELLKLKNQYGRTIVINPKYIL